MRCILQILLLAGVALTPLHAAASTDEYEAELAGVDLDHPDAVYQLAMWCRENGLHYKASRHFKQALALDPDHQPTRNALGQVWYDRRWVHKSRVPGLTADDDDDDDGASRPAPRPRTPGPEADEVDWGLDEELPPLDDPQSKWLSKIVADMNTAGNYSAEMERAWRTLLLDDYVALSGTVLAHTLQEPAFTDIYGPSQFVLAAYESDDPDKRAQADLVLPYLVRASHRVEDAEELYFFAIAVANVGDRRVIPRLIQLLDAGGDAAAGARAALHTLTLMNEDTIDVDSAEEWWDRYHNASDAEIYGNQLDHRDPMVRLAACRRLYPTQDRRIVPTLIEIAENHEGAPLHGAVDLLERITATDWNLRRATPENKGELIEKLEAWWAEEGDGFVFVEFRGRKPAAGDVSARQARGVPLWINQLTSLERETANAAHDSLRHAGLKAVPALIDALEGGDRVRAGKARDLLRTITSQNFGYEPNRGTDDARQAAIAAWREWYQAQDGE